MQSQIGVQDGRGAFKLCHNLVSPPPSAVLTLNWKTNTVITPLATTVALTLSENYRISNFEAYNPNFKLIYHS